MSDQTDMARASQPARAKPLVIGVAASGGDSAAVLVAIHALQRACGDALRVVESHPSQGERARLRRLIASSDTVVLIGAARTGAQPGTIRRIGRPELRSGTAESPDVAQLAGSAVAGGRAPTKLVVYAIEGRYFGSHAGISPEAARAAAVVAERVRAEVTGSDGPSGAGAEGRSGAAVLG